MNVKMEALKALIERKEQIATKIMSLHAEQLEVNAKIKSLNRD